MGCMRRGLHTPDHCFYQCVTLMRSISHTLLFALVSKKYHLFWLLDQTHTHPSGSFMVGFASGLCNCSVMSCCFCESVCDADGSPKVFGGAGGEGF
jgi:hypothetical protein